VHSNYLFLYSDPPKEHIPQNTLWTLLRRNSKPNIPHRKNMAKTRTPYPIPSGQRKVKSKHGFTRNKNMCLRIISILFRGGMNVITLFCWNNSGIWVSIRQVLSITHFISPIHSRGVWAHLEKFLQTHTAYFAAGVKITGADLLV